MLVQEGAMMVRKKRYRHVIDAGAGQHETEEIFRNVSTVSFPGPGVPGHPAAKAPPRRRFLDTWRQAHLS